MASFCLRGLPGPIAIAPELAEIEQVLRAVLVGWPTVAPEDLPSTQPFLVVERDRSDIVVRRMPAGEERYEPTVTSAVCTIVVDLMAEFVNADPNLGSLHAAAVEIAGRLIIFPASHRAGKSTLVAAMAAAGHRVFADDLLPIDLNAREGFASGCLPRLRMPLPDGAPAALVQRLATHMALTDGYYGYLRADNALTVVHGDRRPIGAIVLLARSEVPIAASLEEVAIDEALLRLLLQDTKSEFSAQWALDRYLDIVESVPIHRLRFHDLTEAVACLEDAFLTWNDTVRLAANQDSSGEIGQLHGQVPVGPVFRRNENVAYRVVGGSAFLVDQASNEIHHLNTLGLGVWNLMEQAVDEAMIVEIFTGAFPETPAETIRADVLALLQTFEQQNLVRRCG